MITVSNIFAGDDLRLLMEKTLQTEPGKKLEVNTKAGDIRITVSDRSEVNVKIYGNDNAEQSMGFTAENVSSGILVDVTKKAGELMKDVSIRIEVMVPVSYDLLLNTGGGEIAVTGSNGKVNFSTGGGNVNIDRTVGDVDGSTAGGNVDVSNTKGDVRISTAGGNVALTSFDGDVDISTAGGNISLSGTNGLVKASTAGGNISLVYSGENKGVDLSTAAGKIKVDLPADFNANADISTLVGKIKCDFATVENSRIMSSLQAKFNNGGKSFKCSTAAGDIIINKK